MPKVLVITGPSGVGKGTLISEMRARVPGLGLSTSATTRAPRPGEQDGREYHFRTDEEFEELVRAGEFVEHADYSGNRYGTLRSEVDRSLAAGRSVVLEIELHGARQVRESIPEAVAIFIAPPNAAALRERLEARGTDPSDAIARRLQTAEIELAARDEFQFVVVNDDLQGAADRLEDLVRSQLSLESRQR